MNIAGIILDLVLSLLLGATLFHALRLERALGMLKRDRASLEDLVAGFNAATAQADSGVLRLREAADGAGQQIARQIDQAAALKTDLAFLAERGERLADRLDQQIRAVRAVTEATPPEGEQRRARSQAERDLIHALRGGR